MLTRNVTVNRRVVLISLLTGALVALLVGGIQFWLEQQKREARYDTLLSSIQASYASYFSTIRTAAESLHPLRSTVAKRLPANLPRKPPSARMCAPFCW